MITPFSNFLIDHPQSDLFKYVFVLIFFRRKFQNSKRTINLKLTEDGYEIPLSERKKKIKTTSYKRTVQNQKDNFTEDACEIIPNQGLNLPEDQEFDDSLDIYGNAVYETIL